MKLISGFRHVLLGSDYLNQRAATGEPLPGGDLSALAPLAASATFRLQSFWEPSYWEQTVQFALRDLCRSGQVAYDVGANAGGLSLLMSRRVGPRGIVHAFEASPRIVDKTLYNLTMAGAWNTQLHHRAVTSSTGDLLTLYAGSHLNDSLFSDYTPEGGQTFTVESVSLDDFWAETGDTPAVIKMDIEGAEFDALRGAERLLKTAFPILVLEQSPSDMRCHALLADLGYRAVDLSTYRQIVSKDDFDKGASVVNVLFVRDIGDHAKPYFDPKPELVATLSPTQFRRDAAGGVELSDPIQLPAGRYICTADFSANSTDNEVYAGVWEGDVSLIRYHTNASFMAETYNRWIFELPRAGAVRPAIKFLKGEAQIDWRTVTIERLAGFDGIRRPIVR